MFMLEKRIALVTGASRGIGRAISLKLADEGALVYAGVRKLKDIEDMVYISDVSEGKIVPIVLDVCDKESIKAGVKKIKQEVGRLDILVNNAGITIIERFEMMREISLNKIYDTNVFGVIYVTQMAIRLLKKSTCASIINMSSIMSNDSDIGQTAYASSKAAINAMTKTWAKEFVSHGIRVNAIAPGNVDTEMFNIIDGEDMKKAVSKIGLGRAAKPEEIANVVLFLSSNMASYITGEVISVTGGLVL